MYKKIIAFILVMTLCAGLCACSKGGDQKDPGTPGDSSSVSDYDTVYSAQVLDLRDVLMVDISNVSVMNLQTAGGKVYAMTTSYSDFGTGEQILSFNEDGTGAESGDILSFTGEEYLASCFDADGRLYILSTAYELTENGSEEPYIEGDLPEGETPEADDPGADLPEEDAEGEAPEGDFDEEEMTEGEGPEGESSEGDLAGEGDFPEGDDTGEAPEDGQEEGFEGEEGPVSSADGADVVEDINEEFTGSPDESFNANPGDGPGEPGYTGEIVEEPEYNEDAAEEDSFGYKLTCYEPDGSIVWETRLEEEGDFYYAGQVISTDQGIVVGDSTGLVLYNSADGSKIRTISNDENKEKIINCNIYTLRDGRIAVWAYGENGQEIVLMNADSGEVSGTCPLPGNIAVMSMFPGKTYDMYLSTESGIYGMNMDGSEAVKVLDYLDSDLEIISLGALCELSDGRFAAAMVDEEGNSSISLLQKVDPEVVANRTILTLGCYYIDYEVRKQVFAFNKENQAVRIRILDYSQYDSDTGSEGLTRLNTDIASGNAPDIMLLSYAMPLRSYVAKGVLEDLTPYFEGDEELQGTEFMANIMDAFKTDGKMYTVVPSFYVMTLIGRAEDIGDPASFTLDRVRSAAQERGTDMKKVFGVLQRDILLYNALELCGDRFIDWEAGTCSFDGQEFIDLLEFLSMFPGKLDEADTMVDTTADYRTNASLFFLTSLGSFDDYSYIKHGLYGTDVVMTGFPSSTGAEAAVSPQLQIAVSSSAKDKEACWNFVRRFLSEEYQSKINYYYWPVSEIAMDSLAQEAQEPEYIDDGEGNMVEQPVVVSIGGEMIELPAITEEETEEVRNFIRSIDHAVYYDSAVENIIAEEAAAFFEGQKSAKDVADIIQSRVRIYISENQ